MEAKDLMIGNYHVWDGVECKMTIGHLTSMMHGCLDPEPIPLTEEWLVKFGFTNISDKDGDISSLDLFLCDGLIHFYSNKQHNYNIVSVWYIELGEVTEEPFQRITHVHQLQNLYFALTGEGLTIK